MHILDSMYPCLNSSRPFQGFLKLFTCMDQFLFVKIHRDRKSEALVGFDILCSKKEHTMLLVVLVYFYNYDIDYASLCPL